MMNFLLNICLFGTIGFCGAQNAQDAQTVSKLKDILQLEASSEDYIYEVPVRRTMSGDYLSSRFAQNRKDWKQAGTYLNRILSHDPDNPDLLKRAMVLAIGSGEIQKAIAHARTLLIQEPDNALALLFLAVSEIEQQNYEQAITRLSEIPAGSVSDFIAPILKAWAVAGTGKAETRRLLADSALHAYHALLIEDFLGTLEDTDPYLDRILSGYSLDAYETEKVADILARNGQAEQAERLYKLIQRQNLSSHTTQSKIDALRTHTVEKQPKDIFTSLTMTSAKDGAAEALFDMSRVLFRETSDDSAMIFARLALHLKPSFADASVLVGDLLARNDQPDLAIPLFKNVSTDSPLFFRAQHRAAELLNDHGRREEAIIFLKALYDQHQNLESFIAIGDIYRIDEDYAQALKIYDQAAHKLNNMIPETFWTLLYTRGMTHERLGNINLAEKDLLAAIEFRPGNPYLLNYMGYTWADHGKNLDQALEMIQKAVAIKPNDGHIVDSLGWVYFRTGRYEDAVRVLEKAVALLPYDPVINDHLGDAYWKTGRKTEARFQWNRALNHANIDVDRDMIRDKIARGLKTPEDPQPRYATQKQDP